MWQSQYQQLMSMGNGIRRKVGDKSAQNFFETIGSHMSESVGNLSHFRTRV